MTLSLKGRSRWLAGAAIVLALLAGLAYWWSRPDGSAPSFRFAKVEKGPIVATVSATGTLNPVTSVQVGTQVSGQIKELFVDFNSPVKRGQLIARIDPETFDYRVRQAQADVEAARASVLTAQANVSAARAEVARAQLSVADARRTLERNRELVARNFLSPAELDRAQTAFDIATQQVQTGRAQLAVAEAQQKNTEALVTQREASLASARVDLARTEIRAPVDGVVIKRSVDVGQTVAASLQAPELFVIARDLRDMQVETSIDEADVGRMRIGQRASFTVDAFPGRTFSGEVRQIRKSAQNVQNVITYTVLVSAANDAGLLLPGMTANVRVTTDTRESVLKVANGALRFRPAGDAAGAAGGADKGAAARPEAGKAAPAPAAGGQGAQLRERLVSELKLDADQQARLDPILAEMRAKFMGLRDLPEEQRGKAGAAIRADARAKIEAILRPEQQPRYAEIAAEMAGGRATAQRGRVWVLDGGKPRAIEVRLGLTDGTATEISGEGIDAGLEVIVGQSGGSAAGTPSKGSPPRMFF